jgi:hypothetical protein
LKEIKTIFNLRDFAADTLAKNGTEANFISGTISDQNLNKNILPEITVVFAPETYLRVDTLNSPNCKPEKVAILTNKSHEIVFLFVKNKGLTKCAFFSSEKTNSFKFSNFHASFSFYKFSNFNFLKSFFFVQFDQDVQRNLGGRGHRFSMTLESRIPRLKLII